jgi:hypothetical protein
VLYVVVIQLTVPLATQLLLLHICEFLQAQDAQLLALQMNGEIWYFSSVDYVIQDALPVRVTGQIAQVV